VWLLSAFQDDCRLIQEASQPAIKPNGAQLLTQSRLHPHIILRSHYYRSNPPLHQNQVSRTVPSLVQKLANARAKIILVFSLASRVLSTPKRHQGEWTRRRKKLGQQASSHVPKADAPAKKRERSHKILIMVEAVAAAIADDGDGRNKQVCTYCQPSVGEERRRIHRPRATTHAPRRRAFDGERYVSSSVRRGSVVEEYQLEIPPTISQSVHKVPKAASVTKFRLQDCSGFPPPPSHPSSAFGALLSTVLLLDHDDDDVEDGCAPFIAAGQRERLW